MSLTGNLTVQFNSTQLGTADFGTPQHRIPYSVAKDIAAGLIVDCADLVFSDQRTLALSTSESLDLAGVLVDGLGNTLTFAKVKGMIFEVTTTTVGTNLAIGGAASNQFLNWVANSSDIVNIGAGGVFVLYNPSLAGYAVTAATGDILKVNNTNSGAACTYNVIIWGTSA